MALVALAVALATPEITVSAAAAAKQPKPTITAFSITPTELGPAGGNATLAATVTNAISCAFSSNKAVGGLPATSSCSGGSAVAHVTFPANQGNKLLVFKVTLKALGSGGTAKASLSMTLPLAGRCKIAPFADLQGCDFADANLDGADLEGANLEDADLSGAFLANASLEGADLEGANLEGASLSKVNLAGTNLAGSNLDLVRSSGIIGAATALPQHWTLFRGYLLGPHADLYGSRLGGSSEFESTVLEEVDLEGADLEDVNLEYVLLQGANLHGANVQGVVFPGEGDGLLDGITPMSGVKSGDLIGVPAALPPGWRMSDGYLLGPDADLEDAKLEDADLEGADLRWADLDNADLKNADLTHVNLEEASVAGADLEGAELTGAVREGAEFIGPIKGEPAVLPAGWLYYDFPYGYAFGAPGAYLIREL